MQVTSQTRTWIRSSWHTCHLVMVLVNKKAFKPSLDAIKDKYYQLFRSKGEAGDEEDDDAA